MKQPSNLHKKLYIWNTYDLAPNQLIVFVPNVIDRGQYFTMIFCNFKWCSPNDCSEFIIRNSYIKLLVIQSVLPHHSGQFDRVPIENQLAHFLCLLE